MSPGRSWARYWEAQLVADRHEVEVGLADHRTVVFDTGSRTARPVVFVHSAALDQRLWETTVDGLPDYRCVTYDLRGHGRSSGAPIRGIDQLAEDLLGVLDALDLAQADVVGLSLGGLVAQRIGAVARQRVRSLVLMATAAAMPVQPMLSRAGLLEDAGRAHTVETTLQRWFGDLPPTSGIGYARQCLDTVTPGDWRAVWEAMAGVDLTGGLATAPWPVTCIAGELDSSTPPSALATIAATTPNSSVIEISGAPHLIPLTHPLPVQSALLGHLSRS
uniref:AB hydrolase-1 domain-containing protein n=1 Tax=Mycolicibacterium brisbanense TaxID=146020 RepID=B8R4J4_9MYCO|nr:hypothetical protein [Mycolicibacterium brisbanense]